MTKILKYIIKNKPAVVFRRALLELYYSPLIGRWIRIFPPAIKQKVKSFLVVNKTIMPPVMNTETPKVSIIIPIYNHAKYLDQCIQSAISQDYEHLEIILVDDASTDPAVKPILKKYAENERVRLFLNDKNMGISETQNRAIIESDVDIIGFLDCDDYLAEDAVSSVLPYWRESTVYLHTARINVNENNKEVQRISFEHLPRTDYFSENLERMYATHFKLIRKDVFAKVGLFDPRFDTAQDYDMLMRIAFHYPSNAFIFVPKFAYFHRFHDHQETRHKNEKQANHTQTIQQEARMRMNIAKGYFHKHISIIMLSYGKHEQTYEAVKSIADTVKIPFELILFDNGSDEETLQFLKSEVVPQFPFVKFISSGTNLGIAKGRRHALRHASGEYCIMFDNDEIAQPGWIEELLVRGETDSRIAAVVSRVFYPDNTFQFSGGRVEYLDNELIKLARYDMEKSRFDVSAARFRDCDWVPIGATLFKTDILPYLHNGYKNVFEDAGVSFGLRKQNYRLVNAPGAVVLHNHFTYVIDISMKKAYLNARYNPDDMLKAIALFYAQNNLIIYDEYIWKENGLHSLSREKLKQKLIQVSGC